MPAPALIALMMSVGGGLPMVGAQGNSVPRPDGWVWLLVATGGGLCLPALLASEPADARLSAVATPTWLTAAARTGITKRVAESTRPRGKEDRSQ